jgi:hypothetical protein
VIAPAVPPVLSDHKVAVDGADPAAGFLLAKLDEGSNVTLTQVTVSGVQKVRVTANTSPPPPSDHKVLSDAADATAAGYLFEKLLAGANVTLGLVTDSGVKKVQINATGGGGGSSQATWGLTTSQFAFLDEDGGNDGTGAFQTTGAAALTTAWKTSAALHAAIPPAGNGRRLTILVKPRAGGVSYTSKFLFRGKVGYGFVVIRGSHDGVNDTAERRRCGSVDAISGSATLTTYTVAAGSSAIQFTITGTIGVAVNALRGYRLR